MLDQLSDDEFDQMMADAQAAQARNQRRLVAALALGSIMLTATCAVLAVAHDPGRVLAYLSESASASSAPPDTDADRENSAAPEPDAIADADEPEPAITAPAPDPPAVAGTPEDPQTVVQTELPPGFVPFDCNRALLTPVRDRIYVFVNDTNWIVHNMARDCTFKSGPNAGKPVPASCFEGAAAGRHTATAECPAIERLSV